MCSVASYLVVLFVLDLCTEIHDETVQVPSTITCPFAFARSSHFQSWSGVSSRVVFVLHLLDLKFTLKSAHPVDLVR